MAVVTEELNFSTKRHTDEYEPGLVKDLKTVFVRLIPAKPLSEIGQKR